MAAPIAVVTGGNKGIGYHVAKQLVAAKVRTVIACRNIELARVAAAEIGAEPAELDISSADSIAAFAQWAQDRFGRIDVLVNNAGIAFKQADPTPFEGQTEPTLRTNFYGTVALTDALLPLLREAASGGRKAHLVNVASISGKLSQVSEELQAKFTAPTLDREQLAALMQQFHTDVLSGNHKANGWSNSNYGISKLGVIAFTNVVAREEGSAMLVNSCCPGWCVTDMAGPRAPKSADEGAKTVVTCATLPDDGTTGAFFQQQQVSQW